MSDWSSILCSSDLVPSYRKLSSEEMSSGGSECHVILSASLDPRHAGTIASDADDEGFGLSDFERIRAEHATQEILLVRYFLDRKKLLEVAASAGPLHPSWVSALAP